MKMVVARLHFSRVGRRAHLQLKRLGGAEAELVIEVEDEKKEPERGGDPVAKVDEDLKGHKLAAIDRDLRAVPLARTRENAGEAAEISAAPTAQARAPRAPTRRPCGEGAVVQQRLVDPRAARAARAAATTSRLCSPLSRLPEAALATQRNGGRPPSPSASTGRAHGTHKDRGG